MIRNKPTNYRQQIVKYTEFAAAAKYDEITNIDDSHRRRLGIIEYYLIDIYLLVFIVFIYL